jgi:hypothetical protein
MVFLIRPSEEEADNGFASAKETDATAIENKDYDNIFFYPGVLFLTNLFRKITKPRILHLSTQAQTASVV